jgi:hypothetical protein
MAPIYIYLWLPSKQLTHRTETPSRSKETPAAVMASAIGYNPYFKSANTACCDWLA